MLQNFFNSLREAHHTDLLQMLWTPPVIEIFEKDTSWCLCYSKVKSLLLMPRAVEKLWVLSSPLYIPLKGTEWSSHDVDRPTPISDLSWYIQFISRRMRTAGHVARWGEKRNTNRVLLGKTEVNRPLARWEHNIKLSLQVEWEFVNWIGLDEDREKQREAWPR
jgi:hypothetical protein